MCTDQDIFHSTFFLVQYSPTCSYYYLPSTIHIPSAVDFLIGQVKSLFRIPLQDETLNSSVP